MSNNRPPIPEPLKRELRQEAYFGCVICGNPIIEYHHIEPYHKVKCHEKSNLVVLCPEHHHRANCGEIFKKKVIEAKNKPFNNEVKFIGKEFFLREYSKTKIKIGSNISETASTILQIDNKKLFTIEQDKDGYAVINAEFYNEKNKLIAVIENNEWKAYKEAKLWDISYSPGHLVIKSNKGRVFLELKLIDEYIEIKTKFHYNNKNVSIGKKEIKIGKTIFRDCSSNASTFLVHR